METVSLSFNNLDLIINPLKARGMNRVFTMIDNTIGIFAYSFSKANEWSNSTLLCHLFKAPYPFYRPSFIYVIPKFLNLVFKYINNREILVYLQKFFKSLGLLSLKVSSVFKQYVFGPFYDFFKSAKCPFVFYISDSIYDPVKCLDNMKEIKNYGCIRAPFPNSLNIRSHISIQAASIFFLSLLGIFLKNPFRVLYFLPLPT